MISLLLFRAGISNLWGLWSAFGRKASITFLSLLCCSFFAACWEGVISSFQFVFDQGFFSLWISMVWSSSATLRTFRLITYYVHILFQLPAQYYYEKPSFGWQLFSNYLRYQFECQLQLISFYFKNGFKCYWYSTALLGNGDRSDWPFQWKLEVGTVEFSVIHRY